VSRPSRYRWFVVLVFFFFMLLHQTDQLMIGSMQVPVMDEFALSDTQWGLINTGALVVAMLLYPVWAICMIASPVPGSWRLRPSSGEPPPG